MILQQNFSAIVGSQSKVPSNSNHLRHNTPARNHEVIPSVGVAALVVVYER